jgi:hypothetical protein
VLLDAADPPLGAHLASTGLQPFFALSWLITWWSHELDDLGPASRLFDWFLAGHPLLPLYLGVVLMASQREALLEIADMPELHSALTNLRPVGPRDWPQSREWQPRHGAAGGGGKVPGGGGCGGGVGCLGQGDGEEGEAAAAPARHAADSDGGPLRLEPVLPLHELIARAQALWAAKPPHRLLLAVLRGSRGSSGAVRSALGSLASRRAAPPPGGTASGLRQRRAAAREPQLADDELAALRLTACVSHAARLAPGGVCWVAPDYPPPVSLEYLAGFDPGATDLLPSGGRSSGLARALSTARVLAARPRVVLLGASVAVAAVAVAVAALVRPAGNAGGSLSA